jgi:hypothetical protein
MPGSVQSSGAKNNLANYQANKKYTKLQDQLKDSIASMGGGLLIFGMARQSETLQADSMVLIQHAEPLAAKLTDVARENEAVYKALSFLMSSSVYGAILVEVAGIAMAIAANHGVNVPIAPPVMTLEQLQALDPNFQSQNGKAVA